jgi:hypothetical protein
MEGFIKGSHCRGGGQWGNRCCHCHFLNSNLNCESKNNLLLVFLCEQNGE